MVMPVQGGLFDGGWEEGIGELVVDLRTAVADTARDTWVANLNDRIRVNHHAYSSLPRVTDAGDVARVDDGGSVYGPWLEGQGSRNYPVTRFRGYDSARDATEQVNASLAEIGEPAMARFVEAQNS